MDIERLHTFMGIYGRLYLDLQKQRIIMANRIGAFERGESEASGIPIDSPAFQIAMNKTEGYVVFRELLEVQERMEHSTQLELTRLARKHPMRGWIESTRGIGLQSLGVLLSITGSLDQYPTVSKLWKFLGMHVTIDGTAGKRKRGEPFVKRADADEMGVEATAYNPQGRVLCHQIGEAIVKVGGPYRLLYDTKKAQYHLREPVGPSGCVFGQTHKSGSEVIKCGDAHAHNAAMRYAVKCLIRDLWIEWRQVMSESDQLSGGHDPTVTQDAVATTSLSATGGGPSQALKNHSARGQSPVAVLAR